MISFIYFALQIRLEDIFLRKVIIHLPQVFVNKKNAAAKSRILSNMRLLLTSDGAIISTGNFILQEVIS